MPKPAKQTSAKQISVGLALAAIVVASLNLRAAVTSVGTVLGTVTDQLGGTATTAGLLTALPGTFFAIMGLAAVPIAKKLGLSGTLVAGMVAVLFGLALRPWVQSITPFLLLTGLAVAGIAVMNVLLPAWVKAHGRGHVVTLMTVYSAVLGVSGAIGPLTTLIFRGEDQWRMHLFIWALPAAVQLVVWAVIWVMVRYDFPRTAPTQESAAGSANSAEASSDTLATAPLYRSPTAVFLTLFFGVQSMNAYIQMGWAPQILLDAGVTPAMASICLSIITGLGIVGGLVMPSVIAKSEYLPAIAVGFGVLLAIGYAGLILAPASAPILWAVILGVSGFAFPTALALIPARTRTPVMTARTSGFVQPFGYVIAAIGPFAVGLAHAALDSWTPILITLAATGIVMAFAGFKATQRRVIDDEI